MTGADPWSLGSQTVDNGYPADWDARRKKAYRRDDYTCQNCGAEGGPHGDVELHAHHIIPKSRGGSHSLNNLTTLCYECHNAVHDHHIPRQTGRQSTGTDIDTATSVNGEFEWVDEDTITADDLKHIDKGTWAVPEKDEDLAQKYNLTENMQVRGAKQAYVEGDLTDDEYERLVGFIMEHEKRHGYDDGPHWTGESKDEDETEVEPWVVVGGIIMFALLFMDDPQGATVLLISALLGALVLGFFYALIDAGNG